MTRVGFVERRYAHSPSKEATMAMTTIRIVVSPMAQLNTVASSPARPRPSAARASPAISPPPTREAVLMSSGSAGAWFFRLGMLLAMLATTPPAANHVDVGKLTKPPNDDA